MGIHIGVDVGAVGIKSAVVVPRAEVGGLRLAEGGQGALRELSAPSSNDVAVFVSGYRRTRGRPVEATRALLGDLLKSTPAERVVGLVVTGTGGRLVAEAMGVPTCNEFQACVRAIEWLHPEIRTVMEIGGETSRYLRLGSDPSSGALGIVDYGTNGDCAAGTGAFLDQQAGRLKFAVEQIGTIVEQAERAAQIAGRCSVFAKSDMIHAQQKGFAPSEVLRGLCNAVATNFKSAVVKGRPIEPPVALLGGVSANSAVVRSLREVFGLVDGQLVVPPAAESLGAVGAALMSAQSLEPQALDLSGQLCRLGGKSDSEEGAFARTRPLSLERVVLLRDQVREYRFPEGGGPVDAYLGLDIGSVGTKLVLIDESGEVIHSIFTRTEGRPIEVVTRCLKEMEAAVGWGVRVRGVGSTGSGRELVGELVGADSINDEITAHKTGAVFVGDRLLGRRPDTIFEIGGQDSKFISLQQEHGRDPGECGRPSGERGRPARSPSPGGGDSCGPEAHTPQSEGASETIVVDFTMNEACAAGTGSFLEERAEELGVAIKGEFSQLALASRSPIKLGERCTVFMERDVNTCMQRGAQLEDVIAGLAFSIAHNYINRVVRGRRIGETIFFQGGTAYNDAVAAAFAAVTGKPIIVPPHNAVIGAIGAALLAREKMRATGRSTRFRGYDLGQVDYKLREFTCHGCGNTCSIQEFNVEGEKTFWGDKCSDRYRKQAKTERKPVIPDLVAVRWALMNADDTGEPAAPRATIGIPLAMYTWDWLPMWRRFFRDCGFSVVVSAETSRTTVRRGLEAVVAEPCFPIIVAHGHVAELIERQVDYVWLPNILTVAERFPGVETSYVCPWGSTLPFVVRQSPRMRDWRGRILCPTLSPQRGTKILCQAMTRAVQDLGVSRRVAQRAFESATAAQARFRNDYARAGREALATLQDTGEPGMVLVGRPYNLHDAGVSLSTARKLREMYGVNVLPIDALPLSDVDVRDVTDNMYWAYGQKILAAGKLVAGHPNLHIIYITNFKCGPDSYLKGYMRPASDKPFLTLQFDGHSNDAGLLTRCEAYLDSKGILRWWRTCQSKPLSEVLPGGPSTSPRCPTPVPG